MRKAIVKTNYNVPEDIRTFGFVQDYIFKQTANWQGPKESGRYLTINKKGKISIMRCTGTSAFTDKSLFEKAMMIDVITYFDDVEATDEDLLNLYRNPEGLWYTINPIYGDYEEYSNELCIYSPKSAEYPRYFLDFNLDEIPKNFKDGSFFEDEGLEFYEIDDNGDYVKIKKEEC